MNRPTNSTLQARLLAEARRVLLEEGYQGLSMRRLAKAVGCTATSIYLYFENKDALLHALIDEGMEHLNRELRGSIQDPSGDLAPAVGDPTRLESLCRAYLRFGLVQRAYYELMFMLPAERMERYPVENYRHARRNLELFSAELARFAGSGSAQSDPFLDLITTVTWTSLHGAVSLLLAQRIDVAIDPEVLLERVVRHAVSSATANLRAASGNLPTP